MPSTNIQSQNIDLSIAPDAISAGPLSAPVSAPASAMDTAETTALADFKVGVDTVIFSVDTEQNRLLVLLVMRHQAPFSDYWSLPGTLVRVGESLEDAADRVLTEKIRVNNLYLEQLFTFGGPNRDPRESEDAYNVDIYKI